MNMTRRPFDGQLHLAEWSSLWIVQHSAVVALTEWSSVMDDPSAFYNLPYSFPLWVPVKGLFRQAYFFFPQCMPYAFPSYISYLLYYCSLSFRTSFVILFIHPICEIFFQFLLTKTCTFLIHNLEAFNISQPMSVDKFLFCLPWIVLDFPKFPDG